MNLDERLKRLETKAESRAGDWCFTGPQPLSWCDGYVSICVFIPRDHVPTWSEFLTLGRIRESCPDYADGSCEFSDVCLAGEPSGFNSHESQVE
jgi:hypothetical protein